MVINTTNSFEEFLHLNIEKAIDVQKSAAAKTIVVSKRKFDQKEVAFTGKIPGKNRVSVVDADAKESQKSLKSSIIAKSPNPRKWKTISQK